MPIPSGTGVSRSPALPVPDALAVRHLSKTFPGQVALDDVSLTIAAGEVHALVGQNGSGKSTFIKVLAGFHHPDPGADATVCGRPLRLGSSTEARAAGIRFVHQELGLILGLSVVENFMLGRDYQRGALRRIRWDDARRFVSEALDRVGLHIDVTTPVGELGMADRTAVAIARAIAPDEEAHERILLVLDEPTATLPADDVERLYGIIQRIRADGNSVLLVSHHLDEVLDLADQVSVLRDGRLVATEAVADIDHDALSELIVGHAVEIVAPAASGTTSVGSVRLELTGIGGAGVDDLDLAIHASEIVGVAGLTGSGRETLASLASGRLPRTGTMTVDGVVIAPADPRGALDAGVASIPGERARYGVFANFGVRENMTVGALGSFTRWARIDVGRERNEVRDWIERLDVATPTPDTPIVSLSGGNQQKVLVARALRRAPKVLVLDDPTQGIDIGAREQVHRIIADAAAAGIAVLIASTDSDELARICDRVLVLARGRVIRTLTRGDDLTAASIDLAQLAKTTR